LSCNPLSEAQKQLGHWLRIWNAARARLDLVDHGEQASAFDNVQPAGLDACRPFGPPVVAHAAFRQQQKKFPPAESVAADRAL
jgi:hypothetical protein